MSSLEATVDDTVAAVPKAGRSWDAHRAATALAVLGLVQLTWLAAIVYAAVWLLA